MNKFKLQILLTLSTFFAITVITLISISFNSYKQESITLNTEILRQKTDAVKKEISMEIDVYKDMLAGLNVSNDDILGEQISEKAYNQLALVYKQLNVHVNGTFLFTRDGDIWNRQGKKLGINVKELNRNYYDGIFGKNHSFYMSPAYIASSNGKQVIGMAYRLTDDIAVLASIYLDELLDSVFDHTDMFFFTDDGSILFAPYPDMDDKNIYDVRPHYDQFSTSNPMIQYDAIVENETVEFTAFWNKIDANNWQFVTFIQNNAIEKNAHDQLIESIIIAIICLAFVVGAILFIVQRLIIQPVGGTPKDIADIISVIAKGDLRNKLEQTGSETGIYRSLVQLSQQLSGLIKNSHSIAENVSSSSSQLKEGLFDTQQNAQDELQQVEHIATAINELSSTSQEVASRASEAKDETVKAQQNIQIGQQTLEENQTLTQDINDSFVETASLVNELRDFALEIGSVTDVINGISEQTNLLALNAAIEAARAGEQGRGFAVVADEVRTLASKTQESTINIQDIIEKLQAQSEKATHNMSNNIELVEKSVALAGNIRAAFDDISSSVDSITSVNELVATASQEQFHVTEDISQNTSETFSIVQRNVAAVEKSLVSSDELAKLAQTQKEELSYFSL